MHYPFLDAGIDVIRQEFDVPIALVPELSLPIFGEGESLGSPNPHHWESVMVRELAMWIQDHEYRPMSEAELLPGIPDGYRVDDRRVIRREPGHTIPDIIELLLLKRRQWGHWIDNGEPEDLVVVPHGSLVVDDVEDVELLWWELQVRDQEQNVLHLQYCQLLL